MIFYVIVVSNKRYVKCMLWVIIANYLGLALGNDCMSWISETSCTFGATIIYIITGTNLCSSRKHLFRVGIRIWTLSKTSLPCNTFINHIQTDETYSFRCAKQYFSWKIGNPSENSNFHWSFAINNNELNYQRKAGSYSGKKPKILPSVMAWYS